MPEPLALRVAVFGAGAVGCFVGGLFKSAGLDVTFIGRATIGDEIARHGLLLSDHSGWTAGFASADIRYTTDPGALAEADLIVLTVKCTALAEAAEEIAEHAPDGTAVLCLLNGVRAPAELKDLLPGHDIIAGMVPFNVALLGEGRWHQGTKGRISAAHTPLMEALAQSLSSTRAAIELRSDMDAVAWGKLLLNLNNPVNALSGLTLHEELSQRGYRAVLAASMREALSVLDAAGIAPAKVTVLPASGLPRILETPDWLFRTVGLPLQKIDRTARSSMADDLAKGRRTEIDFLNGEVVTLAHRVGMQAPVNERIVELIKSAENGFQPLAAAELKRAIGGFD